MHRFCNALALATLLSSSLQESMVTAQLTPSRILASDDINILGGPAPHGWTNSSNVDDQANLAFDLGAMYEEDDFIKRKIIYQSGLRENQASTLENLGRDALAFSKNDPLFNYFMYALREVGVLEGDQLEGYFDDKPVDEYAHTVVDDLFGVEMISNPVPGIEKEAVTILSLWMRCYHYMNDIVNRCRDDGETVDKNLLLANLDKAAALWIGRLQVYGDNTRGTMLYNFAERAGVNFHQDHGEVPVNTKLIQSWTTFRDLINADVCSQADGEGYKFLYEELLKVITQMNIPLVQNFIHYITVGAEAKLIELYAVAIFPQIISCDLSFIEYFFSELVKLAQKPEDETNLQEAISKMSGMHSCLGVTCADIGSHSGGVSCQDADEDLKREIAGYTPNTDVQNYAKFDHDVSQLGILLEEGNRKAAFDLYKFGRNSRTSDGKFFTLRSIARHESLIDATTLNQKKRLYHMYEKFYANEGGTNFADDLMTNVLKHSPMAVTMSTHLIQTIIAPQYAIRAFFKASDICYSDPIEAEHIWDQGVAVLVGSIEGESAFGNYDESGLSWYDLGKEYCVLFHCGDKDYSNPIYSREMMKNIKFGRDFIRNGRCNAIHQKLTAMESLLITPLLQGTMFFAYERAKHGTDSVFAESYVYAKAILPFLSVANKEDAEIIKQFLLDKDAPFDYDSAEKVAVAITLSLEDLGVDCSHIGKDNLGIIEKDVPFCNILGGMTQFPTPSPRPTTAVTSPRPSNAPTTAANLLMTEINPTYRPFFTDLASATKKARIALDVKQIASARGDLSSELKEARLVYTEGKHSDSTLQKFSRHDEDFTSNDPIYNFYRDAFRQNLLFNGLEGGTESSVNTYVDAVIIDALDNAEDIELATEALVVMTMFMKIVHSLSSAVTYCKAADVESARSEIESAFAYYIGVGQAAGKANGYLFYSFAQRAASHQKTFKQDTNEANANIAITDIFKQAKDETSVCSSTSYQALRMKVGSIISMMNVPLVQHFLYLLEENAYATAETNYLELFGLAVLPQIKTCQPTTFQYLTKEITDNGMNLDTAKVNSLVSAFKKTYSCFGVTCEQIHGENHQECRSSHSNMYAGFSPIEDVSLNASMDKDLLKIIALMSEEALDSAMEYYENGDMIGNELSQSLKQLAIAQADTVSYPNPHYQRYANVPDLITNAMNGAAPFNELNSSDLTEIVFRAVQAMLFVQAGMGSMYKAQDQDCEQGKYESWGEVAAYLVGSIEGPDFGGDTSNNGVSIYGLAKTMCGEFNVCTTSNDADSNKYLLAALSKGQDLISGNSCAELKDYINRRIVPLVIVPMMQATIKFIGEANTPAAYVMGLAVFPFLEEVDAQAAVTIKSLTDLNRNNALDAAEAMETLAGTLGKLWVDCTDIGVSQLLDQDMCGFNSTKQELSHSLSDGLYVTTTFVGDSAKIAEDIEFMASELLDGRIDSAKSIYQNGLFSEIYDSSGRRIGRRTLKSFSTEETSLMVWEPVFNLYRYTLQDVPVFKDNVNTYADTITMSFFESNSMFSSAEKNLAAESAVALNLWAEIVHKMYQTIRMCESNEFQTSSEGTHKIDEAVAYWIGSTQATGDEGKGHLLYRLAEEGGELFNTEAHDRQSKANRQVLRLFKEAAVQLTYQNACYDGNSFVISQLRFITNKLVSQMTVPLIQHLLHNLKENNRGRVKIYAHAVVPLLAACDESTFQYLKDKLIVGEYFVSEVDDIISSIQSTYHCLDLRCKDIGHRNGIPKCEDREALQSFGDYTPVTDIREYLDIDIDIRYIEIMLNMQALYAAKEIYDYGKHAILSTNNRKEPLSLRSLAISPQREIVPSFAKFKSYFGKLNYADDLIHDELNQRVSFPGSDEQYTALIVNTLQYQVTYMAALQKMHQAVAGCESSNQAQTLQARADWDMAAAFIIGSMQKTIETVKSSNQNDGYLLYGLGLDLCSKFNTCGRDKWLGVIDYSILDSLYSGSFLLEQRSCSSARVFANRIESQLLVPLIQGTLHAAYVNDQLQVQDETFASGYVYSRTILPYIDDVDPDAAMVINKNMDFQFEEEPVSSGYNKVFDAVSSAVNKMGISCDQIGFMKDAMRGVCPSQITSDGSNWKMSIFSRALVLIPFTFLLF